MTDTAQLQGAIEATCALLRAAADDLATAERIVRATQQAALWESSAGDAARREFDAQALALSGAQVECDMAAARLRALG